MPEAAVAAVTASAHASNDHEALKFEAICPRTSAVATRHRVKVIGRLPGERSCLSRVWAVLGAVLVEPDKTFEIEQSLSHGGVAAAHAMATKRVIQNSSSEPRGLFNTSLITARRVG